MKRTFGPYHCMSIADFNPFNTTQDAALVAVTEYVKGLDDAVVNGRGR